MGSESSHLSGLQIQEKPIDTTDFWSQYQATIDDSCRYFSLKSDGSVSVFKGEIILGPLWSVSTPLEKFSNNLLKYRHPCIVRYISAWQQRSTFHLATEYIQPLAHILASQTPLQMCIGLNNILQALVFLHEQAGMSHNNVSTACVYVSGDGQWKLGGLQYLCPFNELNSAYLKHSRIHRYDKAVDPNEDSYELTSKVDQYGFAVLVEDVFRGKKDDEVPHLKEFKKYCRDLLQNSDPTKRPKLAEVLLNSFFNHEFISIYKFLNFLPLKTEDEKSKFFNNILKTLKCYDEETVAKQLGGLLLSRLTLLDQTARKDVVPFILKPKNERPQNGEQPGFFTLGVFKEHVKPRLLQLFGVRDSQIRMLLLVHFTKFVHVFSHEELSQHILPELLLGIKDTDDNLVASTLICLSELVPILGADTVVGGKRSKLFTDGRPNSKTVVHQKTHTPSNNISNEQFFVSHQSLSAFHCSEEISDHDVNSSGFEQQISLNERPSPVGGESIENENTATQLYTNEIQEVTIEEEDWDDWDSNNRHLEQIKLSRTISDDYNEQNVIESVHTENFISNSDNMNSIERPSTRTLLLQKAAIEAKRNIVDISELDIKNQKSKYLKNNADEFDFFADMMPVIEKQEIIKVVDNTENHHFVSKLNFVPDDNLDDNEGWGDSWNE